MNRTSRYSKGILLAGGAGTRLDPLTGTPESMMAASQFVETVELRQGLKIACIEEIAYCKGFITADDQVRLAEPLDNGYGDYLRGLVTAGDDAPQDDSL